MEPIDGHGELQIFYNESDYYKLGLTYCSGGDLNFCCLRNSQKMKLTDLSFGTNHRHRGEESRNAEKTSHRWNYKILEEGARRRKIQRESTVYFGEFYREQFSEEVNEQNTE